jgi:hypothetical protein
VQVKCAKCGQHIWVTDNVESSSGGLAHVECARPRNLTPDERHLLFVYCSEHVVAECLPCGLKFRMAELGADPLSTRSNMCPRCRRDLTDSARAHLYRCTMLPTEVRLKAQAVRDAARHLMKRSQELRDTADVLMREAEVALFEAQKALRSSMRKRTER